jgi:hypothetical protein
MKNKVEEEKNNSMASKNGSALDASRLHVDHVRPYCNCNTIGLKMKQE